jgi:steroid delta-isomerase-like uncharacterized protein
MQKQKRLLFIVLAGLILFYALMTQYNKYKREHKPASPLLALVNQKFAAMNKHDISAIAKLYADNAIITSPNMEKAETGQKGISAVFGRYFTTSPDMVYTISRILTGDSSVTVEYTFSGTMKHLEASVPQYMLNKAYSIKCCNVMEIRNGKITADESYFDQVAFLRQVGFFDQPAK